MPVTNPNNRRGAAPSKSSTSRMTRQRPAITNWKVVSSSRFKLYGDFCDDGCRCARPNTFLPSGSRARSPALSPTPLRHSRPRGGQPPRATIAGERLSPGNGRRPCQDRSSTKPNTASGTRLSKNRESRKLRKQSPASAAWKGAALASCKIDAYSGDDRCIRMFERRRPPNRATHRHDPRKSSYVLPMLLQHSPTVVCRRLGCLPRMGSI